MPNIQRDNLQSFCRTCLGYLEATSNVLISSIPSLTKFLIACTSLSMDEYDEDYPQKLCFKCYKTIQLFVDFRAISQQSAEFLHRILVETKNEGVNEDEFTTATIDMANQLDGVKIEVEETVLQETNLTNELFYDFVNESSTALSIYETANHKEAFDNQFKLTYKPGTSNMLNRKTSKICRNKMIPLKEEILDVFEDNEKSESYEDHNSVSSRLDPRFVNATCIAESRKRTSSTINRDAIDKKKLCNELLIYSPYDHHLKNEMLSANQFRSNASISLVNLMYQLDLSMLCLLRFLRIEQKYPLVSLSFNDIENYKFNSILFRYEGKSTHVHIEHVNQYYVDNTINYVSLFPIKNRCFSIIDYFQSFVHHVLINTQELSSNIEYFIVYTNAGLDMTSDLKFKKGRYKNFYPFEFKSVNLQDSIILREFLFTNNKVQGRGFYQFSKHGTTREEFIKRLEFSSSIKTALHAAKISLERQNEIKEIFFDKLLFAVKQPNREELNGIVKSELKSHCKVQGKYILKQHQIFCTVSRKQNEFSSNILELMYEFKLLLMFLNSMYLNENISSVKFEENSHCISINNEGRITYINPHYATSSIDFSSLFPNNKKLDGKCKLSLNKNFARFVEKSEQNVENIIICTNTNLNLTKDNVLQKKQTKDFYRLTFVNLNVQDHPNAILKNPLYRNRNNLYKLAVKDLTKSSLLSLLKLPPSLQKEKDEGKLSEELETKLKLEFVDKLIFAVNQHDIEDLNRLLNSNTDNSDVPYSLEMLNEISLRWLESEGCNDINNEIFKRLFNDVKSNRSSQQKSKSNDSEKIQFIKRVVGKEETTAFSLLIKFLTDGEGKNYIEVLNQNSINLTNVSSILSGSRGNASKTFKKLYDLWFDTDGNKTKYLKTLEIKKIKLSSVSSILNGAGINTPKAFQELFDMWFPSEQHESKYLSTLEKEKISLPKVTSILSGAGIHAAKAFKELYDLWFDEAGNKTIHLKTLEQNGINLSNISSIIGGAGNGAANAFIGLYDLWFDKEGNKTVYLKTLEENQINLTNITSILGGAGNHGAKAFKDLYHLWFDENGKKSIYLRTLEEEGINPTNLSSILNKSRVNSAKVFKNLYDLWFDEKGNKTMYLKNLENEGLKLCNLCGMLTGTGANAVNVFKDLYHRLLDKNESETDRLNLIKTLKKKK